MNKTTYSWTNFFFFKSLSTGADLKLFLKENYNQIHTKDGYRQNRCLCRAVVTWQTSIYTLYIVCPFISSQLGLMPENTVKERNVICGSEQVTACICVKSFDAKKERTPGVAVYHTDGSDGEMLLLCIQNTDVIKLWISELKEMMYFQRFISVDCLQMYLCSVLDREQ